MTIQLSYRTLHSLAQDARNHATLPKNIEDFTGTQVTYRPANQQLWPNGVIVRFEGSRRGPVELLYEQDSGQYLYVGTISPKR